ncbi:MAG: TIGR02996 domain-containing protein [Archangium sp.]
MKIGDLIKAWQKQPSEALRALILALDDREPLAALQDLESLKTAEVTERLNAFRTKAKDPRVTRTIEQLVTNVKWSSDGAKPMWRAVFELAGKTADPRLRALKPEFKVRPAMQDWLSKQYASAVEELPEGFKPAADEAKWVKELAALPQIKKPAGARDEAALFANVYADPSNDAPRLVLADFLTERGDPRGEFITLQCTAPGTDVKREKALLKEHEKKWLGAIAPVLAKDVEWKRGFPVKGRALFKAQRDADKFGNAPEWATFEELEWSEPGAASANQRRYTLHVSSAFRLLRHADNPFFASLLEGDAVWPHLETLRVSLTSASDVAQFVAAAAKRFPKLHTIDFRWAPTPGWFGGVKALANVKTVKLGALRDVQQWIRELEPLPIDTLIFDDTFKFTRNASGQLAVLTVNHKGSRHVLGLPSALPEGVAESITFEGEPMPDQARQQLLAKAGAVVREVRDDTKLGVLNNVTHFTWLDERHLAIPQNGRLLVVEADSQKVIRSFPCERSITIAALDGGQSVLLGSNTHLLSIDAQNGAGRFDLEHKYTGGTLLQFSADGTRVSRGKVGVFDLKKQVALEAPKGSDDDTRTADDRFWFRWGGGNDKPFQVRWPGVRLGVPLAEARGFSGHFVVIDDTLIARHNKGLVKWDTRTGQQLTVLKCGDGKIGPGVIATPKLDFAFCDDVDNSVLVVTLPELKEVARVKFSALPRAVAISPSGARLAGIVGGKLELLNVQRL